MERIKIKGQESDSNIFVGERLSSLEKYVKGRKVFIITDDNVGRVYGDEFNSYPCFSIGGGEKVKNLATIERIMGEFIKAELDRHSLVVGIGGGIVSDIAGFAASIYTRGVSFGTVSTTLLGQVDAGVGGKTGVNYLHYKNMIGVFKQPEFVICDTTTLKTLKERDYLSGLAEVIKHSLIADKELFDYLRKHLDEFYDRDEDFLNEIVKKNVIIKAEIVNADEKEQGERKKLNFGHTLGHGVENLGGYTHGEAVAMGMNFAAYLSWRKGLLKKEKYVEVRSLLEQIEYPLENRLDKEAVIETVLKDKKRQGEKIDFVLLKDIGAAEVVPVDIQDLKGVIRDLC